MPRRFSFWILCTEFIWEYNKYTNLHLPIFCILHPIQTYKIHCFQSRLYRRFKAGDVVIVWILICRQFEYFIRYLFSICDNLNSEHWAMNNNNNFWLVTSCHGWSDEFYVIVNNVAWTFWHHYDGRYSWELGHFNLEFVPNNMAKCLDNFSINIMCNVQCSMFIAYNDILALLTVAAFIFNMTEGWVSLHFNI